MRPRTKSFWIVISGLVLAGLVPALAVRAFVSGTVGDTVADAVLGQFDFVHNAPNTVDQNSLAVSSNLARMAVDKSSSPNHLWATDSNNNRVLGWSSVAAFGERRAGDAGNRPARFVLQCCQLQWRNRPKPQWPARGGG